MRLKHYTVGPLLGTGQSQVHLGKHKITKEKVAIKFIKTGNEGHNQKLAREEQALRKLCHPHVIRILDVVQTRKHLCLIFPFVRGTTLDQYVMAADRLSEAEARSIFLQLLQGMTYVHGKGIVHRDMKLENIAIDNGRVVILDFGFSTEVLTTQSLLSTACGSPLYAAPEIVSGQEYDGEMADVWSLGVILYAMLCGFCPFDDENEALLYKKIIRCEPTYPDFVSDGARDILAHMLAPRSHRQPLSKILEHPWMQVQGDNDDGLVESQAPHIRYALDVISGGGISAEAELDSDVLAQCAQKRMPLTTIAEDIREGNLTQSTVTYQLLLAKKYRKRQRGDSETDSESITSDPSDPEYTGSQIAASPDSSNLSESYHRVLPSASLLGSIPEEEEEESCEDS
eukprot:TRINITY_DN3349_c0_g2_i1.p1 TRINITY_DN3349_c0_g2~~TRINITY_DN3349_c0_g2_i1.p1  ORF type:complete len:399 (-),score=42.48 TRINITY_DN3349_c0_g2_i1:134-1330(-)